MNWDQRNYSILAVGYVLGISLIFLNYHQEIILPFSLLFIPMIFLAGYWELTIGAFWVTVVSSFTMVGLNLMRFIDPTTAVASVILFGLAFILVTLINHDREKKRRWRLTQLEPKEKELAAVKNKVQATHQQIEEYEKKLKGMVKLYEVSKELSRHLELKPMLDEARMIVAQIMPQYFNLSNIESARLAIYIPDQDTRGFLRTGSRGLEVSDEGFPEKINARDLKKWLGEDFNSMLVQDVREEPRYQTFVEITTFRSLLVVPLLIKEIVIGVLMMAANQPNVFSTSDFNKTEVLGKQIVLALRKALLYRQVQKLSFTDCQTGLYVHRFFQERLHEEIIRAKRYQQDLCLLMMDMDHFKQINDERGHQTGDLVLIEAAKRIKQVSGKTALVARYGGEEFAVILPNTTIAKAFEIATLINQSMKSRAIKTDDLNIPVTISIGISSFPNIARNQDSFIRTADKALYQAKREGRDRVIVYQDKS